MVIDDTETFTIQIAHPFRGIVAYLMSFRPPDFGIGAWDCQKFLDWGCNCVHIPCNWDGSDAADYVNALEPDEWTVGDPETGVGYSQLSASRLHSVIDRVESYGMAVWLHFNTPRKANQGSNPPHVIPPANPADDRKWADKYGQPFVHENTQPTYGIDINPSMPQYDTQTPMPGRARFLNFLRWVAKEFPTANIVPMMFPYHNTHPAPIPSSYLEGLYYNLTQPAMLDAIRQSDIDNDRASLGLPPRQVSMSPLLQGIWTNPDGKRRITGGLYPGNQPYYENDPNVFYSYNTHDGDDWNCGLIARTNLDWDYDYDGVRDNFNGAYLFKQSYPNAKLICDEFIGLVIHGEAYNNDQRPIKPSRIAWVKAMWDEAVAVGSSWTYWSYVHQPGCGLNACGIGENPLESDASETEIAQIISDYNHNLRS